MKHWDGWSYYALALWAANVALILASYVSPHMAGWGAALFLFLFPAWVRMVMGLRRGEGLGLSGPRWAKAVAGLSVAYTFANFLYNGIFLLGAGMPEIQDGIYCLWNHGFVRTLSPEEYLRLKGAESRLFPGHILAFSGLALAHFSGRAGKNNT